MTLAPLQEVEPGLRQCIHCGMCLEACPTYQITRLETESPRGRIHLMINMLEGGPTSDATRLHLDRCLACRACEVVCPSGVPYGHLIEAARTVIAEETRPRRGWLASRLRRLALDVLADPASLARAAAVLGLYERLGLRALLHRTGATRVLPRGLRRLEALYPPFARPRYRAPALPPAPRARVALLLGCVMRVAYGDVHTAAARILARQGIAVIDAPAQTCCGALHAHAGEREDARALARRNIAAFEEAAVDAIVVDAAGCGAQLKGYGALLADDDAWAARAAAFAAKVRDVTEYLAEVAGERLGRLDLRATYQDPCHLAHAQGIRKQPRALLSRVHGLELIEMADADVCCGSAGSYNLTQPEYSARLLERKVDAILATGARAVVSANPGCMLQIEAGLRARGSQHAGTARGRSARPRDVVSARRILVIASATLATIVAVLALLFIPLSIAVGHPLNAVGELALLIGCVWWVARVMRTDRRRRLAAEAALPPERRPERRQPRRPITFQLRETLVTFAIWATLIFAFDAFALGMDPFVNVGVAAFAGFMLATLTVTGRHMMFRLTAEEDEQARRAEENG